MQRVLGDQRGDRAGAVDERTISEQNDQGDNQLTLAEEEPHPVPREPEVAIG